MKGTVILRYVGNRQEPEERAVDTSGLVFQPPTPEEWEKFHEWWIRMIQREMEESFRIPVRTSERPCLMTAAAWKEQQE